MLFLPPTISLIPAPSPSPVWLYSAPTELLPPLELDAHNKIELHGDDHCDVSTAPDNVAKEDCNSESTTTRRSGRCAGRSAKRVRTSTLPGARASSKTSKRVAAIRAAKVKRSENDQFVCTKNCKTCDGLEREGWNRTSFSRYADLLRHERTAGQEEVPQCEFCEKEVSRVDALTRHYKTCKKLPPGWVLPCK
jgi:hypothetical protein